MEQRIHFLDENYRKRKAKTTLLNMDLIMLKTLLKDDTDTIKSFLTYSIQRKIQTANVFNSLEQSKFWCRIMQISYIKYGVRYFPNELLMATSLGYIFPIGHNPNVQFPNRQFPKFVLATSLGSQPVLAAVLGPLSHPSNSARPPLQPAVPHRA